MKTATITWITYNNYGTALQAYALQSFLKKYDVENTIVSDQDIVRKNLHIKDSSSIQPNIEEKATVKQHLHRFRYLLHPILLFRTLVSRIKRKYYDNLSQYYYTSIKLIERFKEKELNILYGMRRSDMHKLNSKFDLFICGSDQIWSVFDHNFDEYFFLNFVTKKKISYAASIGTEVIDPNKTEKIICYLKDFFAISVREQQTASQLSDIIPRNVECVADPTLLHDKLFWTDFCFDVKVHKKKYILCYFLNEQDWYFSYAKKLAKHLHLKLLLLPTSIKYIHRNEMFKGAVGPKEFVSLIKNADFVLTDSYHGSIFSLIFEKNFLYLKRFTDDDPACQNIRIYSLFDLLGIDNLIVNKKKFSNNDIQQISYVEIQKKLTVFQKHSADFIHQNIKDI